MIVCAGEIEQFDGAYPIGIGMIDAAIILTKLCEKKRPEELIFVGTAGSYGEIDIMQIVKSSSAVNIENSFFNAGAYTPMIDDVSCETSSQELIVNSSNYITTDLSLGKYYQEKNIYLENMEFYAIAKVAKHFGISFRGIFCVSNYCNRNAHRDFIQNHSEAKELLSKEIERIM